MRRGAKILFHHVMCVLVAYKKANGIECLDTEDHLTAKKEDLYRQNLGKCSLFKLKCHGINYKSLVGLMFFFILGLLFTSLTWKEFSY